MDILGRFFPQNTVSSEEAERVKNEQERFEKENKEKNEENEKSWRRMKIGYVDVIKLVTTNLSFI